MLRLSHALVLLLMVAMLMPESDGWWLRSRRRRRRHTVVIRRTIICDCRKYLRVLKDELKNILSKTKLGRRDVSTILDVDEDDPLLAEILQKRDGMVTKEELSDAVKRAYRSTHVSTTTHCHCGRKLLKYVGRSLE